MFWHRYLKALSVDDRDAIALYNYGLLLENAKHDTAGAETMYQRALAADPDNVIRRRLEGCRVPVLRNHWCRFCRVGLTVHWVDRWTRCATMEH